MELAWKNLKACHYNHLVARVNHARQGHALHLMCSRKMKSDSHLRLTLLLQCPLGHLGITFYYREIIKIHIRAMRRCGVQFPHTVLCFLGIHGRLGNHTQPPGWGMKPRQEGGSKSLRPVLAPRCSQFLQTSNYSRTFTKRLPSLTILLFHWAGRTQTTC